MRIVVFTADPGLESTPWWPVVLDTPGVSSVLIVRRVYSNARADVLRRLRRNVRKHGLGFIPYRGFILLATIARRLTGPRHPASAAFVSPVPVEEITAVDIHDESVVRRIREWGPDLGVSVGAPLLKRTLFAIPRRGTLNVHLGRVPDFRGAPPGFWELWYGAKEIGVTVHWIDEGLDTGAIVEQTCTPLYPHDTPARAEARATELGLILLARALARAAGGDSGGCPQPAGGRTHRSPTIRQRFTLWSRLLVRRASIRFRDPLYPVKVVAASLWLAIGAPLLDLLRTMRGRQPVRVFTFHRVTDLCRDGMSVPLEVFRRQIEYVARRHVVMGAEPAIELLRSGEPLRRPVAVITFDDGYRSVWRAARPVLGEAGIPATCFVCTGLVGTSRRLEHDDTSPLREWMDLMDWPELTALTQAGWSIGGHTSTHPRLSTLAGPALRCELREPLAALCDRLGMRRAAMAYPFGGREDITPDGVSAARELGYSALFSNFGGENFPGDAAFEIRRIDIGGDHETLMWKAMVRGLDLVAWGRRLRRIAPS